MEPQSSCKTSLTTKTYSRVLQAYKTYWSKRTYIGKSKRYGFHCSANKRNTQRGKTQISPTRW